MDFQETVIHCGGLLFLRTRAYAKARFRPYTAVPVLYPHSFPCLKHVFGSTIRFLCFSHPIQGGRGGRQARTGDSVRFAHSGPSHCFLDICLGASSGQISKNQRAPPPTLVRGWTSPRACLPASSAAFPSVKRCRSGHVASQVRLSSVPGLHFLPELRR